MRRGQKVSESSESFSVVPSLEGPEGFLGLRGPRGPLPGPLPTWWGSCFNREPGEGAPELQGEQKGIMVARMRARQSATSLLGAQAKAGVKPEAKRKKKGGGKREKRGGERDMDRGEAGKAKQKTEEGRSSIPLEFSQLTQGLHQAEQNKYSTFKKTHGTWKANKQLMSMFNQGSNCLQKLQQFIKYIC